MRHTISFSIRIRNKIVLSHIFTFRKHHSLELFTEDDVPEHYRRDKYINMLGGQVGNVPFSVSVEPLPTRRILSKNEKFRLARHVLLEACDVMSEFGQDNFEAHLDLFKGIVEAVKGGKNVTWFSADNPILDEGLNGDTGGSAGGFTTSDNMDRIEGHDFQDDSDNVGSEDSSQGDVEGIRGGGGSQGDVERTGEDGSVDDVERGVEGSSRDDVERIVCEGGSEDDDDLISQDRHYTLPSRIKMKGRPNGVKRPAEKKAKANQFLVENLLKSLLVGGLYKEVLKGTVLIDACMLRDHYPSAILSSYVFISLMEVGNIFRT